MFQILIVTYGTHAGSVATNIASFETKVAAIAAYDALNRHSSNGFILTPIKLWSF